jgi:ABC-type polysaccharide/polyol phosphate export permease
MPAKLDTQQLYESKEAITPTTRWWRNQPFLLHNLVLKDFRIRYRNMSLGVLWSVVNPLVMMGILTFVFTKVFTNPQPHFAVFTLCGLVPFNFYSLAITAGTTSLLENESLIKRVRCPREIFPIAAVLANTLHFLIQIGLLISFVLLTGFSITLHWLWLLPLWSIELAFLCGLALITSVLDVYYRDVRYIVECSSQILFWLVPIFYSFTLVPKRFHAIYLINPISCVVLASREVLLNGTGPSMGFVEAALLSTIGCLVLGVLVFERLKRNVADYL